MHLVIGSGILDLGESPSSFGQTLALLITFLGIGILVNGLIVYIVAQVMVVSSTGRRQGSRIPTRPSGVADIGRVTRMLIM